jgi:hypothetical protein
MADGNQRRRIVSLCEQCLESQSVVVVVVAVCDVADASLRMDSSEPYSKQLHCMAMNRRIKSAGRIYTGCNYVRINCCLVQHANNAYISQKDIIANVISDP